MSDTVPVYLKDGSKFTWGVSASAFQNEGAHDIDGKGPSIWDAFTNQKGRVKNRQHARQSCEFYHRHPEDLRLMGDLGITNFRYSFSWPRLLPNGFGKVNQKGVDFYDRFIDNCLEEGVRPWMTLYHWDLPLELHKKGGWTNREIIHWFGEYVTLCANKYGDRIRKWMVLNEPMGFTGAGYFLGVHAPGQRSLQKFTAAAHHAALCQAEGGRILRDLVPRSEIGTTFSFSHIEPYSDKPKDVLAANRIDALLNRFFLEAALGMGYPLQDLPPLQRIESYMEQGDEHKLAFDFDFFGAQVYTREVIKYSRFTPIIRANVVSAAKRNVPVTLMNWEVYPPSIYHTLHRLNSYENVRKIYITENGAAFPDTSRNGQIWDIDRIQYLHSHIEQVMRARDEGVPIHGYFVWTLTDNFEWAEGYAPRFGLIHVDYANQKRTVKASAHWYADLIEANS